MARKRFHGLKKIKVRQTWNKYNLYNLSRLPKDRLAGTFFQQKWAAKAMTRAYHGEHIKEGKWSRMFSRYIPAVVPMNTQFLAKHDGSDESAGRGSGRDGDVEKGAGRPQQTQMTPYMSNTYWITERRLDTAIWRALFASSARQARQFVVHGRVKVNGRVMKHPSYLLNPGDMFSVDIESVLYATGAQKGVADDEEDASAVSTSPDNDEDGEIEESEPADDDDVEETVEDDQGSEPNVDEAILSARKKKLKDLRDLSKTLQSDTPNLRPKRKIELRALNKQAGRMLSRVRRITDDDITELESQFEDVLANIRSIPDPPTSLSAAPDKANPAGTPQTKPGRNRNMDAEIEAHLERLSLIPNPVDETKTYATPWRPRNYMAPFAFVPRYLEVNHTICSAVYLRHPVVRPGLAEVPTPFELQSSSLAFAWYLRRR